MDGWKDAGGGSVEEVSGLDGWMDGWQWDVSGQRHKMRTRFKKRLIFPGKKKKVVLHSVAQFLKSASKDLLDGAPRISQNALEKKELVEVVEGSLEGETPSG